MLLLSSLQSKGEEESKTIEITRDDKVDNTIPKGKEVLPEGEMMETNQTTLIAKGLE